jgi:glycosyltransferase involved in cell wall biosynthesis
MASRESRNGGVLVVTVGGPAATAQKRLRRTAPDQTPNVTFDLDELDATPLDGEILRATPGPKGRILRALPVSVALAVEAWWRRKRYSAIITWGEAVAIPLGLLLAVTPGRRARHVGILLWPHRPAGSPLKAAVRSRVLPFAIRRGIDRMWVPPSRQRALLVERWGVSPDRFVPVEWPVDTEFWRPSSKGADDLICSVGREMRDYHTLLEAIDGLNVPCHIAAGTLAQGSDFGTEDPRARNVAAGVLPEGVTVGAKKSLELRDLYERAAIVVVPVLPTNSDNGVTTVLEAMAMSKPVVATATEGRADVLVDGETCLLVPPEDPRALREAIKRLLHDPAVRDRLGRTGRARALAKHDIGQWVDGMRAACRD